MGEPAVGPVDPVEPLKPRRRTVEERAARRSATTGREDRYGQLLESLRGDAAITRGPARDSSLRWHPVAGRLLLLALAGVVLWVAASFVVRQVRERQVDQWVGPDGAVRSGQQLASCPALASAYDPTYPAWISVNERVYRGTGFARPVGSNRDGAYLDSGYRLGDLQLFWSTTTAEGRAREVLLVKFRSSDVGHLFQVIPACTAPPG